MNTTSDYHKRGETFDTQCKNSATLTAQWMAANVRDAQREDRISMLFNYAGLPRPYYVPELVDARIHGYVQVPRQVMAPAVYAAARNGGMGIIDSAKLWCQARFAK